MELLAPAGDYSCLLAAVNSGADAVYFAGKDFGARSFAGNFSDEEIYRAADFCHLRGARAYVTINTLVFDREYKELKRLVKTVTAAGVDGVIVQDLGVLGFVREMSPDIEVHASTQMTVHSADGVRELEKLGVSRVVLSRELSGAEMRDIIKNTTAEAEVFVHGAMCMSYSGQCLMSSVIGGRSGNRGKCAQPCRLPYFADENNSKFYLSLKDMSLAEHLRELKEMGVASLKIEGRMKGEAYVSKVVSTYRRLIDEERVPNREEIEGLNRIFFRGGLTDGYFADKKGKEMFAFDKPDNPYLKNEEKEAIPTAKQVEASISAQIAEGEPVRIEIRCGEHTACIESGFKADKASNRPLTHDGAKTQLVKTGGTPFKITNCEVEIKGEPFVSVGGLNELRRDLISALENRILEKYKCKRISEPKDKAKKSPIKKESGYVCSVSSIEQYRAVRGYDFKRIYIPIHIAEKFGDELKEDCERIVISLPVIIRREQRERCKNSLRELKALGFDKAEISTIDALPIAHGFSIYGSQRLNITNSLALDRIGKMGVSTVCMSPEMNLAQLRDIEGIEETEIISYGRIPLMICENCIPKNMDKCPCDSVTFVGDRTGARFPIMRDGDVCRSVVYNSVPLYMGDKLDDLNKTGADMRLLFTTETPNECKEICDDYIMGKDNRPKTFTRLHFLKGAIE